MKTIKLFFIALAVLSVGFFTSCEDDEVATGPTIEFIATGGFITANTTVNVDSTFAFKWIVTKGSADLESFTIRLANNDLTENGYPKTDIDEDLYQAQQELTAGPAAIYVYTFIATDKDGMTDSKTITITTVDAAGDINTYENVIIGSISYNTTDPTYYDAINNTLYSFDDVDADKSDFGYIYGGTNEATLCSPKWTSIEALGQGTGTWSDTKATSFKTTTLTTAQFDAIATDADIITNATGAADEYVNHLQVGGVNEDIDVIAFITEEGKKGLIKIISFANGINATYPEGSGTITISVKIQQ